MKVFKTLANATEQLIRKGVFYSMASLTVNIF